MSATFSFQQMKKLRKLSAGDFDRLLELIKRGGIVDKEAGWQSLRDLGFVKIAASKIWAKFAVNGDRPRPFVGHATKKEPTDTYKVMKLFRKLAAKYQRENDVTLTATPAEWAFAKRLGNQFDLFELDVLFKHYFKKYKWRDELSLRHLFSMKHKLYRECEAKTHGKGSTAVDETSDGYTGTVRARD